MIRDSVIILIITMVILAALELSLRLVFPEKVEKEVDLSSLAYEHDPDTIISLKPNITKEFVNSEINGANVITWKTNSLGYRGEELSEKDSYRIVVYGDSNVQARFSEIENTFPKKLEQFLENEINDVEVINGGLVGAGPDQSVLRFVKDADVIKPDMVVLHIFADNDYGDVVRNRLFELDDNDQLIRSEHPVSRDQQISRKETGIVNYLNSLLLTRAVAMLLSEDESELSRDERVDVMLEKLESESSIEYSVYENRAARVASHFADHYDFDVATEPGGDAAKTKIMLMGKVLELAKLEASKRDVQLIVMVQPAVFDVSVDNAVLNQKDLERYEGYHYTNLTDPIKDICDRIELQCVHLIDEFVKHDPETLYLKEDNHWSDKGQELSARVASKYITSNMAPQVRTLPSR